MTQKDFQILWKKIADKPVNIEYGKQTFRNVILVAYKPLLGIVKTKMNGELNTRSIKAITLIEKEPVIEVEAKAFEVQPRLPDDWNKHGFFRISGRFGGNWKHIEYVNAKGEVEITSKRSMKHEELFQLIIKLKQPTEKRKAVEADVIVDDTFCAPIYYYINKHLSINQIR